MHCINLRFTYLLTYLGRCWWSRAERHEGERWKWQEPEAEGQTDQRRDDHVIAPFIEISKCAN